MPFFSLSFFLNKIGFQSINKSKSAQSQKTKQEEYIRPLSTKKQRHSVLSVQTEFKKYSLTHSLSLFLLFALSSHPSLHFLHSVSMLQSAETAAVSPIPAVSLFSAFRYMASPASLQKLPFPFE